MTSPPIAVAQNTDDAVRKVEAQARLYSDAKSLAALRLAFVLVFAVASSAASLASAATARDVIGIGGGMAVLVAAVFGAGVEKRKRNLAVAVQESFDVQVFQLPWNELEFQRPSSTLIADAAARYTGERQGDWYPDTHGTHRPFDVLICQSSNLGWGAATHRAWAWLLTAATAAAVAVVAAAAALSPLSLRDTLVAIGVPALAPLREALDHIRSNFELAREKEDAQAQISAAWDGGLSGARVQTEEFLRHVQNKMITLRQRQQYVPDWLDERLRARNEHAMRTSAADLVEQARRAGRG